MWAQRKSDHIVYAPAKQCINTYIIVANSVVGNIFNTRSLRKIAYSKKLFRVGFASSAITTTSFFLITLLNSPW